MAAAGLIAVFVAACRAAPLPATARPSTAVPPMAPTPTSAASPWVLVDNRLPPEVQEAAAAWSAGVDQQAEALPIGGVPGDMPPGLWAIVALEENLLSLDRAWLESPIVWVVVEPSSLAAGERVSTLGPESAYDQAGFLAGVAAGLATQTGLIGVAPGEGAAGDWRRGFEEGLLYSCPRCQFEAISDPSQPPFAMDVVGMPPGAESALGAQTDRAPWLVVFQETPAGWADRVAARVLSAPEALVGPALGSLAEGAPGEAWVFASTNGGLAVEVDPRAISPGKERLLREAQTSLAGGRLVVGGGG
jgi:hypothetical protein